MWEQRVIAWRASGQSARAWCREQGISPKTFGYWCRRLSAVSVIVPVVLAPGHAPSVIAPVEISVGRMTVRLPVTLPDDALSRWLGALSAC